MSILELQNVEKIYGEKENQVKALRNINLQVEEGEFVAIVARPARANRHFSI